MERARSKDYQACSTMVVPMTAPAMPRHTSTAARNALLLLFRCIADCRDASILSTRGARRSAPKPRGTCKNYIRTDVWWLEFNFKLCDLPQVIRVRRLLLVQPPWVCMLCLCSLGH